MMDFGIRAQCNRIVSASFGLTTGSHDLNMMVDAPMASWDIEVHSSGGTTVRGMTYGGNVIDVGCEAPADQWTRERSPIERWEFQPDRQLADEGKRCIEKGKEEENLVLMIIGAMSVAESERRSVRVRLPAQRPDRPILMPCDPLVVSVHQNEPGIVTILLRGIAWKT